MMVQLSVTIVGGISPSASGICWDSHNAQLLRCFGHVRQDIRSIVAPTNTETAAPTNGLVLRADAKAPPEMLAALLTNDQKFRLTWNRDRCDLVDQSLSAYDQALTSLALRAGWGDQQAADLIIEFRNTHGTCAKDRDKALRADYIARTPRDSACCCRRIRQRSV